MPGIKVMRYAKLKMGWPSLRERNKLRWDVKYLHDYKSQDRVFQRQMRGGNSGRLKKEKDIQTAGEDGCDTERSTVASIFQRNGAFEDVAGIITHPA